MSTRRDTASPLVTVVMAVYNGEAFLGAAIDSVLTQTYSNLQLVIVDDCSTDESARIIERYPADNRITPLIPRRVLDEVGMFEADLPGVDDYELWLRIALRYPIGHIRTIVGHWRKHPGQQSHKGHQMLVMRIRALKRILHRFPEAREHVPPAAFVARMHGKPECGQLHHVLRAGLWNGAQSLRPCGPL